jgi:thymidylate kinase
VSFSGIDGAGKSTQIELLRSGLMERGLRVQVFRFWDDVAMLTRLREGTGHAIFKGDKGIGSPEAPILRRDKNVRGWPMTCFRIFLYSLDAISLRAVFRRALRGDADFLIFDRYIYDELANLNLNNSVIRAFARVMLSLVPRPDLSFILDAEPDVARARKPEYPLDFIRTNRDAYIDLSRIVGGCTVIAPMGVEAASAEIRRATLDVLAEDIYPHAGRASVVSAVQQGE